MCKIKAQNAYFVFLSSGHVGFAIKRSSWGRFGRKQGSNSNE